MKERKLFFFFKTEYYNSQDGYMVTAAHLLDEKRKKRDMDNSYSEVEQQCF